MQSALRWPRRSGAGLALLIALSPVAGARADLKPLAAETGVDEHVGRTLPRDLTLTDHLGRRRRLGDFFIADRPVLLALAYYHCPGLSDVSLRELATGVRELGWTLGRDLGVLTISIDPTDTRLAASAKRNSALTLLRQPTGSEAWPFTTTSANALAELTELLGYRYEYDAGTKQYAHPAVSIVLTPEGRVARYIYGPSMDASDLGLALREARAGRGGPSALIDRVVLSCFRYDPTKHRYESLILGIMRGGAAAVALMLALAVSLFIHKGRARRAAP